MSPRVRFSLLAALLLGSLPACRGQDAVEPDEAEAVDSAPAAPEVVPPALEEYLGRRIAHTMHWTGADWLLRETREQEEHTSVLFDALRIEAGWTVADLGCGNGYHALEIARRVGSEGRVLGVDIQPEMLAMLQARAADAGISNVVAIEGRAHDPRLPKASCDLILMVDVYHELTHPVQTLAAVRRALKPEGRVVLVEFRAEDPAVPIKELHKMSKQQILAELEANAFTLDEEFDQLPWQHVMFFRAER